MTTDPRQAQERASLTEYQHRATFDPKPEACRVCGAIPTPERRPLRIFPWTVRCVNSGDGQHRGVGYRAVFGKSERGLVSDWNRKQKVPLHDVTGRRNYDEAEDRRRPRAFCKCGLSLPCNSCLVGTHGFQRTSEQGVASGRIRVGG
jgi:hypothetical protein